MRPDASRSEVSLFPLMSVVEVDRDLANDLFVRWAHPLGACERLFGHMSHVLYVGDEPVAATHATSIVSPTVERYKRNEVVELARIARSDDAPWAMRPMLRLWRAGIAQSQWTPPKGGPSQAKAAVSYAMPGKLGDIYRFDGWRFVKFCKKASPGKGSTWAKGSATDDIADGKKGLWIYDYEPIASAA